MKRFVWLVIFCLSCSAAQGVIFSEKQIKQIKRGVDLNIKDKTVREDGEKFEVLTINSFQNEDLSFEFEMRMAIELTDADGNSYFAEASKLQGEVDPQYVGEDQWEFRIAHLELKRPKISAYVVQYGFLVKNEFVSIVLETDDVDSLDELKARTSETLEQKPVALHQYASRSFTENGGEEIVYSGWE